MAWHSYDGAAISYNRTVSSGAEAMFVALQTLLNSGAYTCKSSGDGLAAFSEPGSVFTGYVSGANGLANTGAWFVIKCVTSGREWLFGRGSSNYSWFCLYDLNTGFTGGSATVKPTATGQQGFGAGQNTTAQQIFATSGSMVLHVIVQTTAEEGGVHPFFIIARTPATGVYAGCIMVDSFEPASYSPYDGDPCYMLSGNVPLLAESGAYLSYPTWSLGSGYFDGEWNDLTFFRYGVVSSSADVCPAASGGGLPENACDVTAGYPALTPLPCWVIRPMVTGSKHGLKGSLRNVRYSPSYTKRYGYVLEDRVTGENWWCVDDVVLRGWPSSSVDPVS